MEPTLIHPPKTIQGVWKSFPRELYANW